MDSQILMFGSLNFRSSGLELDQNRTLNGKIIPITDGVEVRLSHLKIQDQIFTRMMPSHTSLEEITGVFQAIGHKVLAMKRMIG
ncbi:ALI_collapsed_G0025210.mRNA.1.CDS.1 [Saccharomyces cerevisiae]|nr:ALI_collapsed_G0025210.mRNA.1.CDS.1 [Saccharomyces cerevisiae]